jgi:hypothetical protein
VIESKLVLLVDMVPSNSQLCRLDYQRHQQHFKE